MWHQNIVIILFHFEKYRKTYPICVIMGSQIHFPLYTTSIPWECNRSLWLLHFRCCFLLFFSFFLSVFALTHKNFPYVLFFSSSQFLTVNFCSLYSVCNCIFFVIQAIPVKYVRKLHREGNENRDKHTHPNDMTTKLQKSWKNKKKMLRSKRKKKNNAKWI